MWNQSTVTAGHADLVQIHINIIPQRRAMFKYQFCS